MKGNKKILVIAVLLLLIAVSFTTYAIYKSSSAGNATVSTAAWVVKVNNTDIVANKTFTLNDITWTTPTIGKNNKIAPGDKGTVNVIIDATGSEVNVNYEIKVGTLKNGNANITNENLTAVAASGSSLTGTINYSTNTDAMKVTVPLEVTWVAEDDATEDGQNDTDIATAAKSITLPIEVIVKQDPTGIAP